MYIKAITTDKEFDSVKNEWIDFEKKVDNKNITSSYLWQRIWWKHFGHTDNNQYGYDKKLFILFLYSEKKELRVIAPFCIVKRKFKKIFYYVVVEFIAQQWGATYLDLVSSDLSEDEFNYVFDWLKKNKKYDLIYLKYIPEFTNNFDLKSRNVTVLSACPEIEGENYLDIKQKYYSKHLKHKLNRIPRKTIKEGTRIEYITVVGEKILNHINDISFVSISKRNSDKYSIYLEPRKKTFIEDITLNFSENSNCIMVFFNTEIGAYNLGYHFNNKFYSFDAAYNRKIIDAKSYSLGILAKNKQLENVFSKGASRFCFGTGIDSYKLTFTKKVCKIYNILYKGNALKSGLIYKKYLSINKYNENNFLKELNEKIPKGRWNR